MNEFDYTNAIEKLNDEVIKLQLSKEYKLGCNIYNTIERIRERNFRALFRYIKRTRIRRAGQKGLLKEEPFSRTTYIDYADVVPVKSCKRVVYTCITKGYDRIADPLLVDKDIAYTLYTDEPSDSGVWKSVDVASIPSEAAAISPNRYCKMHPHELFGNEGFALYIDGNVMIVSEINSFYYLAAKSPVGIAMHVHPVRRCIYDEAEECITQRKGNPERMAAQMAAYKAAGMPKDYGMLEATVFAVDLANERSKDILEQWWDEFTGWNSGRDQLALPYVLWKNGIRIEDVGTLGTNVKQNPKLRVNLLHA